MCLQVDPFDSEGDDDVKLLRPAGDLLDRLTDDFLIRISEVPTTSCSPNFPSESSSIQPETSATSRFFRSGSTKPKAFNSTEVPPHIQIPIPQEASIIVEGDTNMNMTLLQKLYKKMSRQIKVIGKISEGFKDELLITLVGLTGQNAMQMPCSLPSNSGHRYVAMAANYMAFISLLSGVLLRSKAAMVREERRRVASSMLVILGIRLTAAGPVVNTSMNITGVGGYFVPLVCLLPIIGVFM